MPRRQSALGDNMPRRICAPEKDRPGHNPPQRQPAPKQYASKTMWPRQPVPEIMCPGRQNAPEDNVTREKTWLVLLYLMLSPGADCLQCRLCPSRADCLRGIIVSGADFLRAYCHPWNCVSFIQVICHTPLPSQIKVNLNLFWVKLFQLGSFLRKNKNLPVILNLYTGRKTTCCKISETFWKFDTP